MTFLTGFPIEPQSFLFAEDIAEVWNNVSEEHKNILKITVGSTTITAQQQFEDMFYSLPLITYDKEKAKRMFFRIFYQGVNDLIKVKNYDEICKAFHNLDNWGVKEKSVNLGSNSMSISGDTLSKSFAKDRNNSVGQANTDLTSLNSSTNAQKSGQTDRNSKTDNDKALDLTEKNINPNYLSQSNVKNVDRGLNISETKNTNDFSSEGRNVGLTTSQTKSVGDNMGYVEKTISNTSEDIIKYMDVDLPDPRIKFFKRFYQMFTVDYRW